MVGFEGDIDFDSLTATLSTLTMTPQPNHMDQFSIISKEEPLNAKACLGNERATPTGKQTERLFSPRQHTEVCTL